MGLLDKFTPSELFDLATQLSQVIVFGPWTGFGNQRFIRPEPDRRPQDSRASVWYCDGEGELTPSAGWHYCIGFGVIGIHGVSSRDGSETAEACMARVDQHLRREKQVYLVEPSGKSQAKE